MSKKYLRLSDGKATTDDDPKRGVWYASVGACGFWTDDWSSLASSGGIPCCPKCGCVGMQTTAADWFSGAEKFQESNPRYVEFLNATKEACGRIAKAPPSFIQRYKEWFSRQESP